MSAHVVVVAGALANKPGNGGEAWVRLSWIRGLQRIGCEVWFVEQIAGAHCTDRLGAPVPFAESWNRRWSAEVLERFGLTDRSSLISDDCHVDGVAIDQIRQLASDGALLVNISGHLHHPSLLPAFRRRAYVDIDPGFTQFWDADGMVTAHLDRHDRFMTIGENIGRPGCEIPTGNRRWQHIRQPVVLDDWPFADGHDDAVATRRFTTIGTWRGPFGPIERDRGRFGLKVHEFRKFAGLPYLIDASFEAALAIHPGDISDRQMLGASGWHLIDPVSAAGTAEAFHSYVAASMAEFSVAQGIYVETRSGWFSDRTTRYLASGRPVLVQDTGFSRVLPTGKGLVTFTTLGEARAGALSILDDYDTHRVAAVSIAQNYFDSDDVLNDFLDRCDPL